VYLKNRIKYSKSIFWSSLIITKTRNRIIGRISCGKTDKLYFKLNRDIVTIKITKEMVHFNATRRLLETNILLPYVLIITIVGGI